MAMRRCGSATRPRSPSPSEPSAILAGLALASLLAGSFPSARADAPSASPAALAGEAAHAQKMGKLFPDRDNAAPRDPGGHPAVRDRSRPERIDRDIPAERTDKDFEQRLFPSPWNQRAQLLHLPSAAGRLDDQREIGARALPRRP